MALSEGLPRPKLECRSAQSTDGREESQMAAERTPLGREIETALGEVLAHVRGEVDLPCRIVDDPTAEQI